MKIFGDPIDGLKQDELYATEAAFLRDVRFAGIRNFLVVFPLAAKPTNPNTSH